MRKKTFIVFMFFVFLIISSCEKKFSVIRLKIDKINHSKVSSINNDIRILNDKMLIFTTIEKSKYSDLVNEGKLNSILVFDKKYNVIEKIELKNDYIYNAKAGGKHYRIDKKGNIINKIQSENNKDILNILVKYDINEQELLRINPIAAIYKMDFFLDKEDLFFFKTITATQFAFCFYSKKDDNLKIISSDKSNNWSGDIFIENDKLYIYSSYVDLRCFDKKSFVQNNPVLLKKLDFEKLYYRKIELREFAENQAGIIIKNGILYQIRFFEEGTTSIYRRNYFNFVTSSSTSIQTYIIGIDINSGELVKEIKINYSERMVCDAPNAYDIDEQGNIFILDSEKRNIIRIDNKVIKLKKDYN